MTKKIIDVEREYSTLTYEFDGTVDHVISMLKELNDATPEGNTLILNYETEYGYYGDSDRQVVKLYDRRLETDDEYKMRLAQEAEEKENRMRDEMRSA